MLLGMPALALFLRCGASPTPHVPVLLLRSCA